MNFRNFALSILVLTMYNTAWAQSAKTDSLPTPKTKAVEQESSFAIFPSIGYVLQKESFVEANIAVGHVVCEGFMCGDIAWRFGVESNLKNGTQQVIAPKIGLEAASQILAMRISAVDYIQEGQSEFRLLPELGLSVCGLLNITYGYGFRLTKTDLDGIGGHRLCISINVSPKLYKKVFYY